MSSRGEGQGLGRRWLGLVRDLFIVVLGVGLALAADSWWGERQDAGRAREHMVALHSDFSTNVTRLKDLLRENDAQLIGANNLISMSNGTEPLPPSDSLDALVGTVFLVKVFEPLTAAYDNLLSTGDLRLIRDPELGQLLARFRGRLQWVAVWPEPWEQWTEVNQPFMLEHMEALAIWPEASVHPPPTAVASTAWSSVVPSREFRNVIVGTYNVLQDSRGNFELLLDLATQITARLDELLGSG